MFDIQARAALGGSAPAEIKLVVVSAILAEIVGDLVAGAPLALGRFNACTAHLYSNAAPVGENTLIGDIVECTFPGYAPSAALVFSAAGLDDQGQHIVVADVPAPFHCTGDPAGQIVHGIFLLSAAAGNPLLALGTVTPGQALVNGELIPATVTLQVGNI